MPTADTGAVPAGATSDGVVPAGNPSDVGDPARGRVSPAIWCSGVSKRFRKHQALDAVSLQVGRGEVVGLLGPNGAGKTTLIKIMLGLVHADAGELMLLGRRVPAPSSRTAVGYLPELFRFQPWLTAPEVLRLHTRLAGLPVPAHRELHEALAAVGLSGRDAERVGGFSKGMQQRLGLAVALLGRPELVILDEPTSALDPVGRADVREVVLALRERGTTVLLNSHLIGEVERVCDRVVILDRGRVATAGTLDDLLGESEVRVRLATPTTAVRDVLERYGAREQGDGWTVVRGLDREAVPELVHGLVLAGARIHAVEPTRITLEERLLDVLRPEGGPGQRAVRTDRRSPR